MTINIIDAQTGRGKTSAAINYIKSHPDTHFIYVTPYLSEVERIMNECHFQQPVKYTDNTPKIVDLKNLLDKDKNIVTTHSMFSFFDDAIIDLCYAKEYVLIMDEVHDVVSSYSIAPKDLEILLRDFVDVGDNGIMTWRDDSVKTDKFLREKQLCELGCLALYGSAAMIWLFPVKIFQAFRETYLLTYLFDAQIQKYYYDFYGLKYNYLYIVGDSLDTYSFTNEPQPDYCKYDYESLINIIDDQKLNAIGDDYYALSHAWYDRHKDDSLIKQLKNNLINFFNAKKVLWNGEEFITSSGPNNIWTTFQDYKKQITGKGYAKVFIPCNMRASNEYRSRSVIAYPINRFINPVIYNFFSERNCKMDQDKYALSEMIQFIWRSAIRDGNRITLYIPSSRMRKLLQLWILEHTKIKA